MVIRYDISFITKVVKVDKHNDNYVTVWLNGSIDIKPGQFIMVWLPSVEEKPFAVTHLVKEKGNEMFSITALKRGMFTSNLFDLEPGDIIGYRGAYGNGFTIVENKKVCIVAGGIGMAALSLLYSALKDNLNCNSITLIYGAKSSDDMVFEKHLNICNRNNNLNNPNNNHNNNPDLCLCTDDGTKGRKAFTTQLLEEQLLISRFDIVYTCGPEAMMKKVVKMCVKHNVECEASLERYMCCGFGVCGKCAINNKLVCADGPVFDSNELTKLQDFGSHDCKYTPH